ncbi:MAG TPA: EamA family transporter [Rhizomicrobium sp.]|jgi:transporter family protein
MKSLLQGWQIWAAMSAVFAALTAIFGKIGVSGINSDLATLIRTIVILVIAALIVTLTRGWQPISSIQGRTWFFLLLSGAATGASWLCYYRALQLGPAGRVAPIDKLSVVLVALFAVLFLGEQMTVRGWMGVGLIAAGAALIALGV